MARARAAVAMGIITVAARPLIAIDEYYVALRSGVNVYGAIYNSSGAFSSWNGPSGGINVGASAIPEYSKIEMVGLDPNGAVGRGTLIGAVGTGFRYVDFANNLTAIYSPTSSYLVIQDTIAYWGGFIYWMERKVTGSAPNFTVWYRLQKGFANFTSITSTELSEAVSSTSLGASDIFSWNPILAVAGPIYPVRVDPSGPDMYRLVSPSGIVSVTEAAHNAAFVNSSTPRAAGGYYVGGFDGRLASGTEGQVDGNWTFIWPSGFGPGVGNRPPFVLDSSRREAMCLYSPGTASARIYHDMAEAPFGSSIQRSIGLAATLSVRPFIAVFKE